MIPEKKRTGNLYIVLTCIILCVFTFISIGYSNYLTSYLIFFVVLASLATGFVVTNVSSLYKLLFFFIPLSVAVPLIEGVELQFPTEPLIAILTLMLFFSADKSVGFYKKLIRHPISKILAMELAWLLICSLFSELKLVSFKYSIVRICYVMAFYVLIIQWLQKYKKPYYFFLIYALGFVIPIIHGMIFHAKYNFMQAVSYVMPKPFFNDHTVYGACLAFLIPVLLALTFYYKRFFKSRSVIFILIPLLALFFIAEYFSFSRASWLSLALCFLLFCGLKLGLTARSFMIIIFISGSVLWINQDLIISKISETKALSNKEDLTQTITSITNIQTDASNKERLNRWKCAIRMGAEKPLFGFGPRTYKFFYGQYQVREDLNYTSTFNGTKGNAHSEFLSYFSECGVIGLIIHFSLFLITILKGIN
ncbi:MAG: O-antigen ligase family protein, partial [Bacteroidia bacterium]|nr:O-antigen ligase family protein [Bacteroidia bacterium]